MNLFRRKSIDKLQSRASDDEMKRELSAWNLVMLGLGAIVGTGVFILSGTAAAKHAGPAVVISFIVAGICCLFAGLCYAEFASLIPISGSAYTYSYATLGEFAAWIIGWDLILEYLFGAATVAVGWSGYMTSLLKDFGINLPPYLTHSPGALVKLPNTGAWVYKTGILARELASQGINMARLPQASGGFNVVAAGIILIITAILVIGIKESALVNDIIVVIKLAVLALFIGVGIYYIFNHPEIAANNWSPFIPKNLGEYGKFGWTGIFTAASVVFFSYIGFEAITTTAQEVKNPQHDMPIGILGTLVIGTVIFVLVAGVLTGIAPYGLLNVEEPLAFAMEYIGFGTLAGFIKVGAIAGLSSVLIIILMAQPRIFYTMSHDGLLPEFFNDLHSKFKTPYKATIVTGVIAALMAGIFPLSLLGKLVSIGTLLAFAIVSGAVWYLRVKEPDRERPFRTPFVPLVPILSILCCGYLMYSLPLGTWLRLIVWLVVGLTVYFAYSRRHSLLGKTGHSAEAEDKDKVPPRPTYTESADENNKRSDS